LLSKTRRAVFCARRWWWWWSAATFASFLIILTISYAFYHQSSIKLRSSNTMGYYPLNPCTELSTTDDKIAIKEHIIMATSVTGTVLKESKETKVGIVLTQKKKTAPLMIKIIREGGLFEATSLKTGMWVTKVNGQDVYGKSAKEAAALLREAEGEVSVVAVAGDATTVAKPSKDASVGISLKKNMATGAIYITKIAEGSLFSEDLEGKTVVAVNGVAPTTTKEAIQVIKDAESQITLVTRETPEAEEPITEAAEDISVTKESDSSSQTDRDSEAGEEKKEDAEEDEEKKGSFIDNVCGMCV
jgi:hypothetical protein